MAKIGRASIEPLLSTKAWHVHISTSFWMVLKRPPNRTRAPQTNNKFKDSNSQTKTRWFQFPFSGSSNSCWSIYKPINKCFVFFTFQDQHFHTWEVKRGAQYWCMREANIAKKGNSMTGASIGAAWKQVAMLDWPFILGDWKGSKPFTHAGRRRTKIETKKYWTIVRGRLERREKNE